MKSISDLPNGSLVSYRGQPYFVSDGLEERIVTAKDGQWTRIKNLNWKSFKIIYLNHKIVEKR